MFVFDCLQEVDGTITGKLSKMDEAIKSDVKSKVAKLEKILANLQLSVDDTGKTIVTKANDWKMPFYFLLGFVVIALIASFLFYQHMMKKWKLP